MCASVRSRVVTSLERTAGSAMAERSTLKRSSSSRGRRTMRLTDVPSAPVRSSSERRNGRRFTEWPSIETIRSPRLIPAWRAGPASASFTTRPCLLRPTVSPTPE